MATRPCMRCGALYDGVGMFCYKCNPQDQQTEKKEVKKRILVIDDDPSVLKVLQKRLEIHDFEVLTALAANQGLDTVEAERPDLIILDLNMPIHSGRAFLRKLRSLRGDESETPVIILTGEKSEEEEDLKDEIQALLYKPVSGTELLQTIQDALGKATGKNETATDSKAEETSPSSPTKKPLAGKILVVDDEENIRTILTRRLEQNGFQVSTASDGKEGLEKIIAERPDLIICDILMPEMTGYDLVQKLKQRDDGTEEIPVITISAREDMLNYFMEWDVAASIPKPLDGQRLIETIRDILDSL